MGVLGIHKEAEKEEFAARARMLKDMNNIRLPAPGKTSLLARVIEH
jgi:hypothetical protein